LYFEEYELQFNKESKGCVLVVINSENDKKIIIPLSIKIHRYSTSMVSPNRWQGKLFPIQE